MTPTDVHFKSGGFRRFDWHDHGLTGADQHIRRVIRIDQVLVTWTFKPPARTCDSKTSCGLALKLVRDKGRYHKHAKAARVWHTYAAA